MEKGIRLTSEEERVIISGKAIDIMGLSKREWMAGIAMQGMLSNDGFHLNYENIAIEALRYADALIKKLDEDV